MLKIEPYLTEPVVAQVTARVEANREFGQLEPRLGESVLRPSDQGLLNVRQGLDLRGGLGNRSCDPDLGFDVQRAARLNTRSRGTGGRETGTDDDADGRGEDDDEGDRSEDVGHARTVRNRRWGAAARWLTHG